MPGEGVEEGPETIDGADDDADEADDGDDDKPDDKPDDDDPDDVEEIMPDGAPDGRAAAIRCEDGTPPDVTRDELGGGGAGAPDVPASMPATRRARASSVFFATAATIAAISGARAMLVAPSIAPASCRAV